MPLTAFQIQGNTALIVATSSTAVAATQLSAGGPPGMSIFNASTGTQNVYAAVGASSAIQAACPTTDIPCTGMAIAAQSYRNLSTPPGGWLSLATSGGSIRVFATPGAYGS